MTSMDTGLKRPHSLTRQALEAVWSGELIGQQILYVPVSGQV
jgi:hypothetical protein